MTKKIDQSGFRLQGHVWIYWPVSSSHSLHLSSCFNYDFLVIKVPFSSPMWAKTIGRLQVLSNNGIKLNFLFEWTKGKPQRQNCHHSNFISSHQLSLSEKMTFSGGDKGDTFLWSRNDRSTKLCSISGDRGRQIGMGEGEGCICKSSGSGNHFILGFLSFFSPYLSIVLNVWNEIPFLSMVCVCAAEDQATSKGQG